MKDLVKGDRIIRTGPDFNGLKKGEIYTFKEVDGIHQNLFLWIEEYTIHSLRCDHFEKVEIGLEDLSKPTFKVGDRVKAIKSGGVDKWKYSKGHVLEVTTAINEHEFKSGTWYYPSEDFELIKDSKTPPCIHQSPEEKEEEVLKIIKEHQAFEHKEMLLKASFKGATKHDSGKPSFSAIPQLALLEVAKGFTHGKIKYGKFNYSGAVEATRLTDALQRHLNQYLTFSDKNDIDESGVHHLANVACNAMMLLDAILNKTVIDDRNQAYNK